MSQGVTEWSRAWSQKGEPRRAVRHATPRQQNQQNQQTLQAGRRDVTLPGFVEEAMSPAILSAARPARGLPRGPRHGVGRVAGSSTGPRACLSCLLIDVPGPGQG